MLTIHGEWATLGAAVLPLKLESCVLRSWSPSDAKTVQGYANNRKIWLNVRDVFPHPYTLEDAHAFLNYVLRHEPRTTLAIATDAEAIGCIGLRLGADIHARTAELGYWLGEPFWGRGIMSEAVAAFTRYAFDELPLVRIFAEPFATNGASTRVLEKAGFICEGRLRSNIFKDGQVLDSLLYSCLRSQQPVLVGG